MRMRLFKGDEHPITAVVAVVAIVAAIVLILWARYALHGSELHNDDAREIESAAAATRFATGFSP
jgi:hypothetical protein